MRDMSHEDIVTGIVTSRRCPLCGHHGVGHEVADVMGRNWMQSGPL